MHGPSSRPQDITPGWDIRHARYGAGQRAFSQSVSLYERSKKAEFVSLCTVGVRCSHSKQSMSDHALTRQAVDFAVALQHPIMEQHNCSPTWRC